MVERGTVERLVITSEALRGNTIGCPRERAVDVYIPAGAPKAVPLLVDLVGFTGSGMSHTNWRPFTENVPARVDRLIATGAMPPVMIAFPDCFTRLGGNQYIDNPVLGDWEQFLAHELVPAVEGRYGCGGAGRRGLFGKSSGGYGAIINLMRHPDVWSAAASHSGDMAFELCYLHDLPRCLRELERAGSVAGLLAELEATDKPSDDLQHAIEIVAMAVSYDPDPSAPFGFRSPADLRTAELDPARWAAWLAWDPTRLVEQHAAALRSAKALYVDVGVRDQYNLVHGARRFDRELTRFGVAHRYDEFADDHTAVDYRMDHSLPFLARALTAG